MRVQVVFDDVKNLLGLKNLDKPVIALDKQPRVSIKTLTVYVPTFDKPHLLAHELTHYGQLKTGTISKKALGLAKKLDKEVLDKLRSFRITPLEIAMEIEAYFVEHLYRQKLSPTVKFARQFDNEKDLVGFMLQKQVTLPQAYTNALGGLLFDKLSIESLKDRVGFEL